VRIFGLDFTSAPSRRKLLIALECALEGGTLRVVGEEEMPGFGPFEEFLRCPGPWVCAMDFPFGQPRSLVEAAGWPLSSWEGYVDAVGGLSREEFEGTIRADMATRPSGSKYRWRLADRRSGSSSAMMLFRVPVGKMFFRGAPMLLRSGVTVEPCRRTGSDRVAVEAYPALVARRLIGRRPYKTDEKAKQTGERRAARRDLVRGLSSERLTEAYGFTVELERGWRERFVEEPAGDALDSLLCAVQGAWAYTLRDDTETPWGVPSECDPVEGWILDPALLETRPA